MDESPRDPYARYRPEGYTQGQVQQPRFIPNEPATACQPQQSYHPQYGQPHQEWGPPPAGPPPHVQTQPPKPRKKRRVFMWVLMAVQVIFIIWLISAGFTTDHTVTHCTGAYCKGATEAGSAIGIGLIVVFWVVVDLLMAIPYAIYRLATRSH